MTFAEHQAATAQWMGYPDTDAMNASHDRTHGALCAWLGIRSHSLMAARGEDHDAILAAVEEDAVLHIQRLMAHHGVGVPQLEAWSG